MGRISNRFYVAALEDGTTLHGNLSATAALSQAYNPSNGACIPNWATDVSSRPTIYLTLLEGNEQVQVTSSTWYYNGVEITAQDTRFSIGTYPVPVIGGSGTISMPALTIVDNLASSANVDMDTITLKGTKNIGGAEVEFSATCQVRISSMTTGGGIGVINFVDGVSDITSKGQTITAYGILYNDSGTAIQGVTTQWYLNDSDTPTSGTSITVGGVTYSNAFQISESDVIDHATIRCEFYADGVNKYTAYAGVDDMQDPEFLYIQYNGNNGNAASLRKNEAAEFKMWIGTRDNPDVLVKPSPTNPNVSIPVFGYMRIMLLNGDGGVVMDNLSVDDNIPNADANGWRVLDYITDDKKFRITPTYNTVMTKFDKNMTGIVMASDEAFT